RPTEELMQNVAASILAIEDPAKRSAAAVDFFGKSGTRFLPLLPEIAKGFNEMSEAAKRAGAVISDEALAKLDALADASERSQLKIRALFAENAAGPLTAAIDFIHARVENLVATLQKAVGSLGDLFRLITNPALAGMSILGPTPLGAATSQRDAAAKQI